MTPADRDAAVALAREVTAAHDQFDADERPVHVYTDGGLVTFDWRHAALARAVLALAERPTCDWQPIATAPKDGRDVLLTNGTWKRAGYWARRIETWSVNTAVPLPPPTHWMPLPALMPLPAPPAPLPSCSICRRDDCGGDHPCE